MTHANSCFHALPTASVTDSNRNIYCIGLQTDSNGRYSCPVPATGTYTVTPSALFIYWFTPKSQSNVKANQTQNFVGAPPITVYLLHGIGHDHNAMAPLYANLTSLAFGIDLSRFNVVWTFDFGECANYTSCGTSQYGDACSVSAGGKSLAHYLQQSPPPGDVIFIGYSLGGLIARDLIANNYLQVLGPMHQVAGLITLGAPNLGYPWSSADEIVFCKQLVDDMSGSWLPQQTKPALSPYLSTLNTQWQSAPFYPGYWLAAAGESCSNPTRNTSAQPGCLPSISSDPNSPLSDGIVCRDSAANYSPSVTLGPAPTSLFEDPQRKYVHSTAVSGWGTVLVLCGNNSTQNPTPLVNPPFNDLLFSTMETVMNAH